MTDSSRIWTAAEMAEMTPGERDAIVSAGFIDDPAQAPAELMERIRAATRARIAARDGTR